MGVSKSDDRAHDRLTVSHPLGGPAGGSGSRHRAAYWIMLPGPLVVAPRVGHPWGSSRGGLWTRGQRNRRGARARFRETNGVERHASVGAEARSFGCGYSLAEKAALAARRRVGLGFSSSSRSNCTSTLGRLASSVPSPHSGRAITWCPGGITQWRTPETSRSKASSVEPDPLSSATLLTGLCPSPTRRVVGRAGST
jgi:hypothetical protein